MDPGPGFGAGFRRAWRPAAVGAVLVAAAFACGRRGPPLPPVRVTPEEPRLLPLRQEGGEIVIRWVAPSGAAGGDNAELRLRRAVVLHRLVDLERRIGEARAARRGEAAPVAGDGESDPAEGGDERGEEVPGEDAPTAEPPDTGAGGEEEEEEGAPPAESGERAEEDAAAAALPESAGPTAPEERVGESDAAEPEPAGGAPAPPAAPGVGPEPGEESRPGAGAGSESAEGPDTAHPPGAPPDEARTGEGEADPAGPEQAGASTTSAEEAVEGSGGSEAERGEDRQTEPIGEQSAAPSGEPPAETSGEEPAETGEEQTVEPGEELAEEPEAPAGVVVEYGDGGEELEVLSEVESETPGEERTLRLPVRPDWVGRRLVVALRYESRSEPSGESERREIDVTAPLPEAGPVTPTVEAAGVALAWPDVRPEAAVAAPLSNPLFEIVRRRGTDSAQAARIPVPRWTDGSVVWGEEVCYSVRLVVVGDDEPRIVEDPGPEFDPAPPDSTEADADSASAGPGAAARTEEAPASGPPGVGGGEAEGEGAAGDEAGGEEAGGEEAGAAEEGADETGEGGAAAPGAGTPEGGSAAPTWRPVPVQVPPTGSRTMSAGPRSGEACLVPEDTFAPPPPTDVRAFWRAEATELNWRAADAPDVLGYAVYRSEAEDSGFERLTPEPVSGASFSDRGRDPEARYFYAVTALDGADPPNESPRSAPVPVRPRSR